MPNPLPLADAEIILGGFRHRVADLPQAELVKLVASLQTLVSAEHPDPETFLVECEHCAVVPGPHGTQQVVIFNPKGDTVARALAWKKAGDRRYVEIDDRSGLHVRKVAALVIHYVYDYNTLWLGLDK